MVILVDFECASRVQAALEKRKALGELLSAQLIEQAGAPNCLLNLLIRYLCTDHYWADQLEAIAASSLDSLRTRVAAIGAHTDPLQSTAALRSLQAELSARDAFLGSPLGATVEFLDPDESGRTPDLAVHWENRTALIEVKWTDGLADDLHLARAVASAWFLLYPRTGDWDITIWVSEEYHDIRLGGGGTDRRDRARLNDLRQELLNLLKDEVAEPMIERLASEQPVPVGDGLLYFMAKPGTGQAPIRPVLVTLEEIADEKEQSRKKTLDREYLTRVMNNPDRTRTNTMSSLRGLAHVAFAIRSALPQLYEGAKLFTGRLILVPYVYYSGYELHGVNPDQFAGAFDTVLHWDLRLASVLEFDDRSIYFYGRDSQGTMEASGTFTAWAKHLNS
jgi:hypothetical protein